MSPRVPTQPTTLDPSAREAPLRWHADLRQDHEHTRSDENQKTATLGGILAEEIHETPGKRLAGDDCNATARPLPGPRQDPCRGRQLGHFRARTSQDSTAVPKQLLAQSAGQAPAWRRAASMPTRQAPVWWHADLHEDPATAPAQQPASLRGIARLVVLDMCRSKARQRRMERALLSYLIKQEDT